MTVSLDHSRGYRYLRVDGEDSPDGSTRYVSIHRLVLYAHGRLDSPLLDQDPREVHHVDGCRSRNGPSNLDPLDPADHGSTSAAQDVLDAVETVGVEYTPCPSCSTGRPHERLADGALRCVVCRALTEDPDGSTGDQREVEV